MKGFSSFANAGFVHVEVYKQEKDGIILRDPRGWASSFRCPTLDTPFGRIFGIVVSVYWVQGWGFYGYRGSFYCMAGNHCINGLIKDLCDFVLI